MINQENLDTYECSLCGFKKLIPEGIDVYSQTCDNGCFKDKKCWHEPYGINGNLHVVEELDYTEYTEEEIEKIKCNFFR